MTTEEIVVQIVRQLPNVKADSVRPDSDLFTEIDLDSLAVLELVTRLEGYFRIKLFPDGVDMNMLQSPHTIAEYIGGLLANSTTQG